MARTAIHKRKYYAIFIILGVLSGVVSGQFISPVVAILIGWGITMCVLAVCLWLSMCGHNADITAAIARHQYLNRTIITSDIRPTIGRPDILGVW